MKVTAKLINWERAVKKLENYTAKVIAKASEELFINIIMDTPVDTGRLRGHWHTSLDSPNLSTEIRLDPNGNSAIREVKDVLAGYETKRDIYFTNIAPYVERIEFGGYSREKAPNGMVRINLIGFKKILERHKKAEKI